VVSIVIETIIEILLDLMVFMGIIVDSVSLYCNGLNGKSKWFLLVFQLKPFLLMVSNFFKLV